MFDTHGKFYLGRRYDLAQGQVLPEPILYDPDDLTTHAFVVGMTGSGKTGLCIDLLEEAAFEHRRLMCSDVAPGAASLYWTVLSYITQIEHAFKAAKKAVNDAAKLLTPVEEKTPSQHNQ